RPRLLFVGTSFVWTLTDLLHEKDACERLDVYYYFKSRIRYPCGRPTEPPQPREPLDALRLDLAEELRGYDAALLEIDEGFLDRPGSGFPEAALRALGVDPDKRGR